MDENDEIYMYAPDDSLIFAYFGARTLNRTSLTWIASVGRNMRGADLRDRGSGGCGFARPG